MQRSRNKKDAVLAPDSFRPVETERAVYLADKIADQDISSDLRHVQIELIAGIAAIEDKGMRLDVAYAVVREIFLNGDELDEAIDKVINDINRRRKAQT